MSGSFDLPGDPGDDLEADGRDLPQRDAQAIGKRLSNRELLENLLVSHGVLREDVRTLAKRVDRLDATITDHAKNDVERLAAVELGLEKVHVTVEAAIDKARAVEVAHAADIATRTANAVVADKTDRRAKIARVVVAVISLLVTAASGYAARTLADAPAAHP